MQCIFWFLIENIMMCRVVHNIMYDLSAGYMHVCVYVIHIYCFNQRSATAYDDNDIQ